MMNFYDKSLNNINLDKNILGNSLRSRQGISAYSLDKIYSKSSNSDLTFEEIDENIKKCYTNLQYLKNTVKKSKISLIKSSISRPDKSDFNLFDINTNKIISNEKLTNNINQNDILKNSSSSSNLLENFQKPIMHIENKTKKNNNNITKYSDSSFSIFNKFRPISPSINLNSSNRNHFNSPKNYLDKTNILHNSSSSNDKYYLFLHNQFEENKNRKNNDLFNQYQEMKKNNYIKNSVINNNLDYSKKEEINYEKKYKECLEQIETLKISIQDYQKVNKNLKESILTLKNKLNHFKNENNKNKEQELINKYKNELKINEENNKKLKEEKNKLIEEIQILSNENKDLTNKISILLDVIKNKDKTILNLQKINGTKTESDISILENEEKSKIYKKKPTKEFSLDKTNKKIKTKKHIEEITLKIPKYNSKGKIIEIPIKKFSYEQLLKENEENKIKINVLSSKLNQYSSIQKKYEELIQNQQLKDDETINQNFISSSTTPLETLFNEIKKDEIHFDINNFNNENHFFNFLSTNSSKNNNIKNDNCNE